MSDVEFDTDVNSAAVARPSASGTQYATPVQNQHGMAGWLISKGVPPKMATIVLLGVVVLALAATYLLLRGNVSSSPKPAPLEYLYSVYGRP